MGKILDFIFPKFNPIYIGCLVVLCLYNLVFSEFGKGVAIHFYSIAFERYSMILGLENNLELAFYFLIYSIQVAFFLLFIVFLFYGSLRLPVKFQSSKSQLLCKVSSNMTSYFFLFSFLILSLHNLKTNPDLYWKIFLVYYFVWLLITGMRIKYNPSFSLVTDEVYSAIYVLIIYVLTPFLFMILSYNLEINQFVLILITLNAIYFLHSLYQEITNS